MKKNKLKQLRAIAAQLPPAFVGGIPVNHYRRIKKRYIRNGGPGIGDYLQMVQKKRAVANMLNKVKRNVNA